MRSESVCNTRQGYARVLRPRGGCVARWGFRLGTSCDSGGVFLPPEETPSIDTAMRVDQSSSLWKHRDPTSAVPPQASQEGSSGVGGHIPWVARGMRYEFWADPLKQHRPKDEVACDFRELWGLVVRANTEPPVQPKNGRQRAWDEPEIVEIRMEKACTYMRLDHPAVDGIRGASHEAE